MSSFYISGNIVDIHNKEIFPGTIIVENGHINTIARETEKYDTYILPGFIDAHVHIESSMLLPSEFARLAVVHGTVASVSDPHEIANVLGVDGVKFMIENGKKVPFKFNFGAPSCVPATPFETSGAALGVGEVDELLKMKEIRYLSEMMNFPGVLMGDKEVMAKLALAKKYHKKIDGHAPGLKGEDAKKYAAAGITTDHECFTMEEAMDKIHAGMHVLIREGSAAKNFEELIPLLEHYSDHIMLCSDDKHPDDLEKGHINLLVKRAISNGYGLFDVLKAAILNPVEHYELETGLLREGDAADFIVVDNLADFNVESTYIDGVKVADNGITLIESVSEGAPNKFHAAKNTVADLEVVADSDTILVQKALEGQLITEKVKMKARVTDGKLVSDTENDILKMMVMNRYEAAKPAIDFVNNFGLKSGAIASTVAHDSHNIIAVGTNDEDIVKAVNLLIEAKGGVCAVNGDDHLLLSLPVAGIMSANDGYEVAGKYHAIDKMAKDMGSTLNAPFMTLSFMALLVIPAIKLSDKGLFDGEKFEFISMFEG